MNIDPTPETAATQAPAVVEEACPDELTAMWGWLHDSMTGVYDPSEIIAVTAMLERIQRSISAAQVRLAQRLRAARLAEREELEERALADGTSTPRGRRRVDSCVGDELSVSRRQSPRTAGAFLKVAAELDAHLPNTLTSLSDGLITETMARIVAHETRGLTAEDRHLLDLELLDHYTGRLSDGELRALVRTLVGQLDQGVDVQERSQPRARRVSCRRLPHGKARLTAELSAEDAEKVMTELDRQADLALADPGEHRDRDQVMADTLVERVTGHDTADHDPETSELGRQHASVPDVGLVNLSEQNCTSSPRPHLARIPGAAPAGEVDTPPAA